MIIRIILMFLKFYSIKSKLFCYFLLKVRDNNPDNSVNLFANITREKGAKIVI